MNGVAETKKQKLSKATSLLMHIAARSHSLRESLGIELLELGDQVILEFRPMARPWLVPKYDGAEELTFDADIFAKTRNCCSTYEAHMRTWLLNVWNPRYAEAQGWHFDFFQAMGGLDQGNREAIIWWMQHPIWP